MLFKLLSYFYPINIYKSDSKVSKTLEVTWLNGKLVLDSQNTNYSFGSLQRILKTGLKNIGFEKIKKMNSVLILGVAGGSVINTLKNEIKFEGKITGIEIDKEIIEIANRFFKLNEFKNTEILIDDAYEFVQKTNQKYDLIIIDIFQDAKMPDFLYDNKFIEKIKLLLNINSFIVFNTMVLDNNYQNNLLFKKAFVSEDFNVKSIPNLEGFNELIIIEKIV